MNSFELGAMAAAIGIVIASYFLACIGADNIPVDGLCFGFCIGILSGCGLRKLYERYV